MFGTVPYRHTAYDQVGPVAAAPQPVKTERVEARPAAPMHLVPVATQSFLKLADVEKFYARETVNVVKTTRAMLMTARGRAAATKHVGHIDAETSAQFAARVISTANPTALVDALRADGIPENYTCAAYHCCWVSTALRFAKGCRDFPRPPFDRVGNSGQTMLSIAINCEAEIAVYWLVRSGASPRAPNANGITALSRCVERCVRSCVFAIDECVHERMKILMLCDAGNPRAGDEFADAMFYEMTRVVDEPKKTATRKRKSKK
jgi:hypothetical protein